MASTDARPVPKKNVAYRHYFAIRDNAGALVTTWAGQDTELSQDGGNYADATNEATEIQTSGTGYIDLTAGEMNNDSVVVKVTVTNTDALPYVVVLFPEEAGDIRTDVTEIGGDAQSLADLKDFADEGYDPATNKVQGVVLVDTTTSVSNLSVGSSGVSTIATTAVVTTGAQTGTYTNTQQADGVNHQITDVAGTTDLYYQFSVGAVGIPSSVTIVGRSNGNNDSIKVSGYNWGTSSWEQVGTIVGKTQSTNDEVTFSLLSTHVGTGANSGLVRVRFNNTGLTSANLYIDFLTVAYSSVGSVVGYANGSIWIDTVNGTAGTVANVNGVADNPVDSIADANTLAASVGLSRFYIVSGSSITLAASQQNQQFDGCNYTLALGGQDVSGTRFSCANVTGIASGTSNARFDDCGIGAVTLPPCELIRCGIGASSGTFTAASDGEFVFDGCHSLVPGAGTPSFVFSGLGATTGINNRGWLGGASYTLDSDCTVSHEVLAGGGQTFVTGGASVELRGIYRSATYTLSGAGTIQQVGVCGPVTISGASTATVNIYGLVSSISDTSSGTTVNDLSAVDSILAGSIDTGFDIQATLKRLLAVIDGVETRSTGAGTNIYTYQNKAGADETVHTVNTTSINRTIS